MHVRRVHHTDELLPDEEHGTANERPRDHQGGQDARGVALQLAAERGDQDRASERQCRDQGGQDIPCHPFKRLSWLMSTLSTFRFIITRMARPTVTSAAATSMMKNTKTCPPGSL